MLIPPGGWIFEMEHVDLTIEICGMSGDGTIAAGGLLNEAMSRAGYSVLGFDSYPAEIRGFGRCVTRTRIGDEEIRALSHQTDVLISLDDEQSRSRVPSLSKEAVILFDNRPPTPVSEERSLVGLLEPEMALFGIPFGDLAAEATGTRRGRNLAALGGFSALFGIPPDLFHDTIRKKFQPKGEKVLDANLKSFDAGYRFSLEQHKAGVSGISRLGQNGKKEDRRLLSGNEAISLGALDAGLKLYFGYPITPATPIMEYLAKVLPKKGGRVMQMEDEIASIGGVLGSFYAGQRAMTATSGPGFALMTELITHGVMAEIPAVIIDAQRGGPATGLPTKSEQSDLHAAVFGGPGDSARIVIAPTDVSECYSYTMASFRLAERYQTPVIVLTDFFLDNRVENVSVPQPDEKDVADGNIYPEEEKRGRYLRYGITESGISPRSIPGMEGYIFKATGLEHSEQGIPDYSPENHIRMSEKRHRKLQEALKELPPPESFLVDGNMDLGVISWGSTFGAAIEAVKKARDEGRKVCALKITSIYPYHADRIREFVGRCREVLIPELNYEGQMANLIGHLHKKDVYRLNRVGGEPFTAKAILEKIRELS
jgi:2-oxoglutarate ferredoxin oxidoreductase subunit alpha